MNRRLRAIAACLSWLAIAPLPSRVWAGPVDGIPAVRLWWYPDLGEWTRSAGSVPGQVQLASPPIDPPFGWNEAIVSWNAPTNVVLEVEAWPEGSPHGYTLGRWSADTNAAPRSSVPGQQDAWGKVETDTLVANQPARMLRIRVRARKVDGQEVDPGALRIGVSLVGATNAPVPPAAVPAARGRHLDVPLHSQADYPEGVQSWCSPASIAMLLGWWRSRGLGGIPDVDVRAVAHGVNDPAWPGTGNWPFNTAFAGQQPGLAACVARFAGLGDIEAWIAAGRPVAASVSYAQLKGAPIPLPGDGHLVVVTGFTATGDVWVNDPGVNRERGTRVVPRDAFDRAWKHSRRTVYLVWPSREGKPTGGNGRW